MHRKMLGKEDQPEITTLFTSVFTLSGGGKEGSSIGNLASELALGIDNYEIICFGTCEETIIGTMFFTRLQFKEEILVYLLAPVAVSEKYQRKGVGQSLIRYGLDELKNRSVAFCITCGDPSFYSKVDF